MCISPKATARPQYRQLPPRTAYTRHRTSSVRSVSGHPLSRPNNFRQIPSTSFLRKDSVNPNTRCGLVRPPHTRTRSQIGKGLCSRRQCHTPLDHALDHQPRPWTTGRRRVDRPIPVKALAVCVASTLDRYTSASVREGTDPLPTTYILRDPRIGTALMPARSAPPRYPRDTRQQVSRGSIARDGT